MATRSYKQETPRPYGESAGIRLIAALEGVGADPFTSSQAIHEGAALSISPRHTLTLLNRLAGGGWLTRIKKGLYAITDPVTRLPKAHPFAIGTALVAPSAISHWSALQHWGLTEQISATITLSSPKRTFPPSNGSRDAKARRAWVVAGVRYEVVAITKPRFFGLTNVWVSERDQVAIFERERALLDAFQHFHIFGSISVGLEILENHLADLELSRLVGYAQQLQVAAVTKRIGWALEKLHVPLDRLEPLLAYPAKGDIPLDPGRPPHGRHNSTWHVIENLNAR